MENITKCHENPDIYRIGVPLPESPLRETGAYLLQSEGESLLVDTGFAHPVCRDALREALAALHVDVHKLIIFVTHVHSDHMGCAAEISEGIAPILMTQTDYEIYRDSIVTKRWYYTELNYLQEGFPEEGIKELQQTNPARRYASTILFAPVFVTDGMEFAVGSVKLRCITSPGHTPGHCCLYVPEGEILFLGDHILFDITPNNTRWFGVEDSLGDYLESLKKFQSIPVRLPLPGHRGAHCTMEERIEELFAHHERRLAEVFHLVETMPESNSYELAAKMDWSMGGKSWEEAAMKQKWFAVGETMSHLDYLRLRGRIAQKKGEDGLLRYTPLSH